MTKSELPGQAQQTSAAGETVSAVVRSLLGRDQVSPYKLAEALNTSYDTYLRRLKDGRWSLRDVEVIAAFFGESLMCIYTGQGIDLSARRGSEGEDPTSTTGLSRRYEAIGWPSADVLPQAQTGQAA